MSIVFHCVFPLNILAAFEPFYQLHLQRLKFASMRPRTKNQDPRPNKLSH